MSGNIPEVIKPGLKYTTTWANNKFISWELVDVTQNQAYLKGKDGTEFSTHVNNLRVPLLSKFTSVETKQAPRSSALKEQIKPERFLKTEYMVIDVETSGFSEKANGICQISAIAYDIDFNELSRFNAYIRPYKNCFGNEVIYTSKAEAIHGLTKQWLNDNGEYVLKVAEDFVQFCYMFTPKYYVGHNIDVFDKKFVASLVALHNMSYSRDFVNCKFIDTIKLARETYKSLKSYSLESLCKKFNIINEKHHNSFFDAKATAEILKRIKQSTLKFLEVMDSHDIKRLANKPNELL